MSIDRSAFISASAAAAEEADRKMRGDVLKLEAGVDYVLRFCPAFTSRNGEGIWWSFGQRHYKVPCPTTDNGRYTFDCPNHRDGSRCVVCENQAAFEAMNMWSGRDGVMGKTHVRFNVIDVNNPEAGVQVLEDSVTLWRLLKEQLKRTNIMDPFDGKVIGVQKLKKDPWRSLFDVDSMGEQYRGGYCPVDAIHPDALSWCLPENLPNLDESWYKMSWEKQLEVFKGETFELTGGATKAIDAPAPAPAPAPAAPQIASTPKDVPAGTSNILDALRKTQEAAAQEGASE